MILSEHTRRWAEIRFYQYCVNVYGIRHKTIDIVEYTETVCNLGDVNSKTIKKLINIMLNDTYYQSTKREVILLAHTHGYTDKQIAEELSMTKQGVNKYIKTNLESFTPLPRCGIDEDTELVKFIETLDKLKDVGTLKNGTTD